MIYGFMFYFCSFKVNHDYEKAQVESVQESLKGIGTMDVWEKMESGFSLQKAEQFGDLD